MATQIVMDHTGDSRHQFDPADAAAVAEAEARFKELTGAGFTAAKRLGEGKSEVLRSFDPTAEETLFIPSKKPSPSSNRGFHLKKLLVNQGLGQRQSRHCAQLPRARCSGFPHVPPEHVKVLSSQTELGWKRPAATEVNRTTMRASLRPCAFSIVNRPWLGC
jgi:hypothetical protein